MAPVGELLAPGRLSSLGYAALLRSALLRSHVLLRERDSGTLRARVLADALELWDASAGRYYDVDPDGSLSEVVAEGRAVVPALACEMEAALLPRALACEKSLLSSHPRLDADLADLADRCRAAKITTHVLLVRAHQQTYGAGVLHWLGTERPDDWDGRSDRDLVRPRTGRG